MVSCSRQVLPAGKIRLELVLPAVCQHHALPGRDGAQRKGCPGVGGAPEADQYARNHAGQGGKICFFRSFDHVRDMSARDMGNFMRHDRCELVFRFHGFDQAAEKKNIAAGPCKRIERILPDHMKGEVKARAGDALREFFAKPVDIVVYQGVVDNLEVFVYGF